MRNLWIFLMILTVSAFAGEHKKHDHSSAHKSEFKCAENADGHALISVPTMKCENCVKTVKGAVKELKGVENVQVNLDKKMVHVDFDSDALNKKKIAHAIADAGYDAGDVKRNEKAHNNLPMCCQTEK